MNEPFSSKNILKAESPTSGSWMPQNSFQWWTVPRSLVSQGVKISPVLFTRNLSFKMKA
jgi:hypothetical protein